MMIASLMVCGTHAEGVLILRRISLHVVHINDPVFKTEGVELTVISRWS
jgi:hypothetical protein